jgi:hypothetical protein
VQVELKEMELSHEEILKNLQTEYDKQVTRLREDLQRQARVGVRVCVCACLCALALSLSLSLAISLSLSLSLSLALSLHQRIPQAS